MDTKADLNAQRECGDPQLLEKFRHDNPHLHPLRERAICRHLWRLLSPRHRQDSCCHSDSLQGNHLTDHLEVWQDTESDYYVYIAHPYCDCSGCAFHQQDAAQLAEQGLIYRKSSASWYYPGRTSLTILGRPDVLKTIKLGKEELDLLPVVTDVRQVDDNDVKLYLRHWQIDAEMIEAKRLAEEQVIRDRHVRDAVEAEDNGDFQFALNLRSDVAYADRTGGFHKQARKQLQEGKRLITEHPGLDVSFLYFANEKDARLICGPAAPSYSKRELALRIAEVDTPFGAQWRVSHGQYAFCVFQDGETRWELDVSQGGNLRLWSSAVERLGGDGRYNPYIHTIVEGKPRVSNDHCHESPEAAAQAAIRLWQRYDQEVEARKA